MNVLYTLKKNSDFRRLYSRGKSAVMPCMVVYCRRNPLGHNRVGYTVSTKIGNAVTRNRGRRRLREVYRLLLPQMKQGFDIVIVARKRCVEAKFPKVQNDLLKALEELGIIKEAEM